MVETVVEPAHVGAQFELVGHRVVLAILRFLQRVERIVVVRVDLALARPQGVQGLVAHHAEDPAAPGAPASIEAGRPVPDADKGVVQHVFRQLAAAHDAQRHAQQMAAIVLVDAVQRLLVAQRTGVQGSVVIETVCCHRQSG